MKRWVNDLCDVWGNKLRWYLSLLFVSMNFRERKSVLYYADSLPTESFLRKLKLKSRTIINENMKAVLQIMPVQTWLNQLLVQTKWFVRAVSNIWITSTPDAFIMSMPWNRQECSFKYMGLNEHGQLNIIQPRSDFNWKNQTSLQQHCPLTSHRRFIVLGSERS